MVAVAATVLTGCSDSGSSSTEETGASAAYTPPSDGAVAAGRQRMDDAYDFCVDRVTEQLKAPATAQFSNRDPAHEGQDAGRYLFTGTVDSENSFGALIRSDWACDIRWTGGTFVAESVTVA